MENNNKNETFFVVLEADVLRDKNLTYSAKILYACICFSSNNEKGYCFRTNKELMDISNISEKQFYRNIKVLKQQKYITTIEVNNSTFYIPMVNNIYLEFKKRRKQQEEELKIKKEEFEIIDFDWLNDR